MDVSFCANTSQGICLQISFSVVNKCEMWKGASFDCFGLVVFAVCCVECKTVSQCFMCLDDLRVDLVWRNSKCVVHPELTLCGCRDVKIQGLKGEKNAPS